MLGAPLAAAGWHSWVPQGVAPSTHGGHLLVSSFFDYYMESLRKRSHSGLCVEYKFSFFWDKYPNV